MAKSRTYCECAPPGFAQMCGGPSITSRERFQLWHGDSKGIASCSARVTDSIARKEFWTSGKKTKPNQTTSAAEVWRQALPAPFKWNRIKGKKNRQVRSVEQTLGATGAGKGAQAPRQSAQEPQKPARFVPAVTAPSAWETTRKNPFAVPSRLKCVLYSRRDKKLVSNRGFNPWRAR